MGKGKNRNLQQRLQQAQRVGPVLNGPAFRHQNPGDLLGAMVDGREYESLIGLGAGIGLDLRAELTIAINAIQDIRQRPLLIYAGNVVNRKIVGETSISLGDDLPFSEMIAHAPAGDSVDILIVTPGGTAQQVAQFVMHIRRKYKHVSFLIPYIAMSAGTLWALSGEEIWMSPNGLMGPIDPQVPGRDGRLLPAQAILTLIKEIQNRGAEAIKNGKNPDWTDQQILRNMDAKEVGNAISQSKYAIQLAAAYLQQYKFASWQVRSSTGQPVSAAEKIAVAASIAEKLCSHELWKMHSHGITREALYQELKLKITHTESIPELDRVLRRIWALMYWVFENTNILKIILSSNYAIIRSEVPP